MEHIATTLDRIRTAGRIVERKRARKIHDCKECGEPILQGEVYLSITIAGAGLGSIKFPDRIHLVCLGEYLRKRQK